MSGKQSNTPSKRLDNMVKYYLANVKSQDGELEMEVKFGTKNIRKITRNQFDNVAKRFTSLGFIASPSQHMLRIQTYDGNTNRISDVRTTITGLSAISTYCRTEQITGLATFEKKYNSSIDSDVRTVENDEFNFRVSLNVEKPFDAGRGITKTIEENWSELRKNYRLMNRITFNHKDYPLKVDLSIVKSSRDANTFSDSGVVNAPEFYEIEIEVDNNKVMLDADAGVLGVKIRTVIKNVLSGLQSTNYPVSITEQTSVLEEYQQTLFPNGGLQKFPGFIGPSSFTLQIENIVKQDAELQDTSTPNIRDNYTVTDKADGERKLMFITKNGRIYLIDTNMNVQFTGAITQKNKFSGTLIDGEHIQYDKYGAYINLYAAFDIYYKSGKDQRQNAFYKVKRAKKAKEDKKKVYRYNELLDTLKHIETESVVTGEPSPLRIESKHFYSGEGDDIFKSCEAVLEKIDESGYEYKTDGLIFTPSMLGVGADKPEQQLSSPKKFAWKRSFKWKPPEFNTIDFLVKLERRSNGEELVSNIFKPGTNMGQQSQLIQYKTAVLHVGFNEERDGYPDAFDDVINGKIPEQGNRSDSNYVAKRFYPTNPYDRDAAICNLMMSEGANGKTVLKTEEGEVIEDKMVVEFSYDPNQKIGWRWKPLRVRYDKTADTGGARYGNAYHVANSNWHSIHNPVKQTMLTKKNKIPEEISLNEDVYYNRASGVKSYTRGLRDYHNWVKSMLISKVAKQKHTLIDLAVGKGGDMNKWAFANLGFVFGIDYSKDNIENRIDGACARYLNALKRGHRVSKSLFVHGDSSVNIRNNEGIFEDKGKNVVGSIFGSLEKEQAIGKAVNDAYEIGKGGFDICSIQFAIHYMFESPFKLHNFLRNVSETTKLGGYFIGTSYDGSKIFNMLKEKAKGESMMIQDKETGEKIWQVTKEYDNDEFRDDNSSLGYAINVYQETINKVFTEYLVNYNYLTNVLRNYGFEPEQNLIKQNGFKEFHDSYLKTIRNDKRKSRMNNDEKSISFLNRVFVFKKVRNVDAEQVSGNMISGDNDEEYEDAGQDEQNDETKSSEKVI